MKLKQIEPVIEKIGDNDFYITPFAAFKAANLTGELASVLTPLFSALIPLVIKENEEKDGGLMDVDAVDAATAMANCTSISGDKLEKLIRKLILGGHIVVEMTNEDGENETVKLDEDLANEIFCGDIQDMFILCFYVIKLNFNGFFKKFASLSGKEKLAGNKIVRAII